jgi:hypothetical protein
MGPFLRSVTRKMANVMNLAPLVPSAVKNAAILSAPTVILQPVTRFGYKVFVDLRSNGAIGAGFPRPKAKIVDVRRHQDNSTI